MQKTRIILTGISRVVIGVVVILILLKNQACKNFFKIKSSIVTIRMLFITESSYKKKSFMSKWIKILMVITSFTLVLLLAYDYLGEWLMLILLFYERPEAFHSLVIE